ncbi:calcium-binding protein, partial [Polynucleobacter sp. AP-Titi-500A-B4]|uniref:beta strand repeat-containing protein n=1 Tax=Polynucleobacter sp. AP-Titi-500A-B4 TaxID=2576923 RepID=UPI001BFDA2E5
VTLTANPNYETKAAYSFNVVATDAAGNASNKAVSLAITNVNDTAQAYDNYSQATITTSVSSGTVATTLLDNFSTASASWGSAFTTSGGSANVQIDNNLTGNNILNAATDKWGVSTLSGTTSDAGINGTGAAALLRLTDNNGNTTGAASVITPQFVVTSSNLGALKFDAYIANNGTGDLATWTLYKLAADNTTWNALTGTGFTGSITATASTTITSSTLSVGTYRLMLSADDKSTGGNSLRLSVDNFNLDLTPQITNTAVTHATGNILTTGNNFIGSTDSWGSIDVAAANTTLSILSGASFVDATSSGVSVTGQYGTLILKNDGTYDYTPTASVGNVGLQEVFTYKLTNPGGDVSTANLVIDLVNSVSMPSSVSAGTAAADVVLGTSGADSISGLAGSDHLEGLAGADTILGGDGNDIIIGGLGLDSLTGGAGQDTFAYTSLLDGKDKITDFSVTDGDRVDLSHLLNDYSTTLLGTSTNPANVQAVIGIVSQATAATSTTTLSVQIGGVTYEMAALSGVESGVPDLLASPNSGHTLANELSGASWTDVVDITSLAGGPSSITAQGGSLSNTYNATGGDWTVIIKSGTATVDTANKQIVFSTDHAGNEAVIVTADGTQHDITHVDKIQWHG